MNIKVRFTILGLVFMLSTLVFWVALNETLIPLRAQQATNFRVFFLERNIECNVNGLCLAYLYGSATPGTMVAGVQGSMTYSSNLDILGLVQDSKCSADSFGLESVLNFKTGQNADGSNVAKFAIGTRQDDSALKDGNHCIAAVIVQPKGVQQVPDQGSLQLSASSEWRAGGSATINVEADVNPVTVAINDTAPIPSVTPPPTGGETPSGETPTGNCDRGPLGDGNCDGKIDLVDWDMGRSAQNGEGGTYDPNGDGVTNALDLSLWIQNNDFLPTGGSGEGTVTPAPSNNPRQRPTTAATPTPSGPTDVTLTPSVSPTPISVPNTTPGSATNTPTPGPDDTAVSATPTP